VIFALTLFIFILISALIVKVARRYCRRMLDWDAQLDHDDRYEQRAPDNRRNRLDRRQAPLRR
jgi:hypothetical protein